MSLFLRVLLSLVLPVLTLLWIPSMLWPRDGAIGPARFAAIPVIAVGVAILASCIVGFAVKGKGTLAPVDPPRKLVTAGLYRFVRNPMYVGGLLVLLGQAIYFQSTALLLYALGWWLAVHLFIVLYEEPHLKSIFGSDYDEYRRTVSRWIPRLRT